MSASREFAKGVQDLLRDGYVLRLDSETTDEKSAELSLSKAISFRADNIPFRWNSPDRWEPPPLLRLPYPVCLFEWVGPGIGQTLREAKVAPGIWRVSVLVEAVDGNRNPILSFHMLWPEQDGSAVVRCTHLAELELNAEWEPSGRIAVDRDPDESELGQPLTEYSRRDGTRLAHGMLPNALQAIGILNCRGVEVRERQPPAGLNRARSKSGRPALLSFRTIEIAPLKVATIGKRGGAPEPKDLALHSVRGHFADYRKGNGLFGRHKGLFWVGPHIRGDPGFGTVGKDYVMPGVAP